MAKNKEKGAVKISRNRENYAKIDWILLHSIFGHELVPEGK